MLDFIIFLLFALPLAALFIRPVRENAGSFIKSIVAYWGLLTLALIAMMIWRHVMLFESLEFVERYWTEFSASWGMFLLVSAVAFVIFQMNWSAISIQLPKKYWEWGQDYNTRSEYPGFYKPWIKYLNIALALVTGIIFSAGWLDYKFYQNGVDFGVLDPVYSKDVAFYVFKLPWLEWLVGAGIFFIIILGVVTIIMYSIFHVSNRTSYEYHIGNRTINWKKVGLYKMVSHLSILASLFCIALLFRVQLDIYELVYSTMGVVIGAGYTDLNVILGKLEFFRWLLGLLAIMFLVGVFVKKLKTTLILFGSGVGVCTLYWLIFLIIVPLIYESNEVEQNAENLERPYIERNIEYTRKAWNLTDKTLTELEFQVSDNITPNIIEANAETFMSARMWSWEVILQHNYQWSSFGLFYEFWDADIVRYDIDGKIRQCMMSLRELDFNKVDERSQKWLPEHMQYTHGYGACLNPVNETDGDGKPVYWVDSIPAVSRYPELAIKQPRIYYGELTDRFIYTGTHEEFDYITADDKEQKYVYAGSGGIRLGSGLRALAWAIGYGDIKQLRQDELTADSRIHIKRDLYSRVNEIAPWFAYDRDPYAVIADSQFYFIWDGFTYTDNYPYSERFDVVCYGGTKEMNYIRNSIKVVMDCYNGDVWFYINDPTDPIVMTYAKIFPDLFRPIDEMPASLRIHTRNPEDYFLAQSKVLCRYHMDDVGAFYKKSSSWEISWNYKFDDMFPASPRFVTIEIPGSESLEFAKVLSFSPYTREGNDPKLFCTALLVGRCDGENQGNLILYKIPPGVQVDGPGQMRNDFGSDSTISKLYTLWGKSDAGGQGSTVLDEMPVYLMPLKGGIVCYIMPIYMSTENVRIPKLKMVLVSLGGRIAYGPTFNDALNSLLRGEGFKIDLRGIEGELTPAKIAKEMRKFLDAYRSKMGSGNFSEAGADLSKVFDYNQQLINLLSADEEPAIDTTITE